VRGHTPAEVTAAVVSVAEALKGKTVNPARCKGVAKQVLGLWVWLERPDFHPFVAEVCLVADAFHRCPDGLFARDVRAEGWATGIDRRRHEKTLCVRSSWFARLETAEEWDAAGRPEAAEQAAELPRPVYVPDNGAAKRARDRARLRVLPAAGRGA
jgi:hypothetical protein